MRNLFIGLLLSSVAASGAANLAMSSAGLSADGTTLVIPFTGTCQSPLSPSSAIGGFTVFNGGYPEAQAGVTASGCTVTIILGEPVSVDEALTVSLSSTTGSGYLTDSPGNTPAGQATLAVANNSEWHAVTGASMSGRYRAEGSNPTATAYAYQINFVGADGCYRINATATQLDLFAFDYSNHWVLRQDGATIHDWGQSGSGTAWTEQGLVTGLSGTHEYDFCAINPQNNGAFYASLVRVRITGSVGAQPAVKAIVAAVGDSITALFGPQPITDSTTGDLYQVASVLGYADQFAGSPGATVCSGGNTIQNLVQNMAFSGSFPLAFMAGSSGYNDHSVGTSASALGTCWDTLLTEMDNLANPPTHIVIEGMLSFVTPIDPSFDAAIAGAVAGHPRACFVPRLNWIDTAAWNGSTGDRQSDQLHIHGSSASTSLTGYAKIANRELPIAAGYTSGASFMVGGGAGSGPLFSSSPPFTAALPGAAIFADPVTVSSSTATDVLCIVGSTCGTGSVTLPANWGSHTFQYTITPANSGPRTIGYSGLANCWTAPSPTTFTATGTAPRGFLFGD
jgi:hypothetical protein